MSWNQGSKPENALQRALELQSIDQPDSALTTLHDVLSSSRRHHRTWSPTYEKIMLLYIDLCLKLNRSREAKDGLHQYRNLSQSQAPGSLENVILYLLDKSESLCEEAKASVGTDTDTAAALLPPEDGDDTEEVEGNGDTTNLLLLSTMTADPAQSHLDSKILIPRIKFLWESYRAVLDILKSNSKLERLYHMTAGRALKFCGVYQRRMEFKRLCDLLRQHLDNLKKFGGVAAMAKIEDGSAKQNNKIRGWEGWTSESIELHLQTRFTQLEVASKLKQYNEGFKVVEEIHNILQISHSRRKSSSSSGPKAKLMAKYYEKLIDLFWVSENYLFHAFAWYKFYTLCREYNRGMTKEQTTLQASAVLLSALAIPTTDSADSSSKSSSRNSKHSEDITKKNSARMATLLGFHTRNPTREGLLSELRAKNVMADVPEYLRELYHLLEENRNPLALIKDAKPLLDKLTAEQSATSAEEKEEKDSEEGQKLSSYVEPLTSVLLLKLLHALSASYHTISLDHIESLTSELGISFTQVEKAIVAAATTKTSTQLRVKIDHRARSLRFGDAAVASGKSNGSSLESDTMKSQLTILSKQLSKVCKVVNPPDLNAIAAEKKVVYDSVRDLVEKEHEDMLARKDLIEKRKEEMERLAQEKLKEEEEKKLEALANAKAEEKKRLQREQMLREREKLDKIRKEMELTEKKNYLKAMGQNVDAMTDKELADIDVDALAKEHAAKAAKKKDDAERKVKEMGKKLDYIVRATRIEEVALVKKRYAEKIKLEKERYEADVVEKAKQAKVQWEADCEEKARLKDHSVFDFMKDFEKAAMVGRKSAHSALCKEEDTNAEMLAEKAKLQRARKRKDEEQRKKAAEEARLLKEEEERKAEEERRKRDEERRKKEEEQEELRRKKESERMAADREKRMEREANGPAPSSRDLDNAKGGSYQPPSRRGGGGGNRWESNEPRRAWGDSRGSSYGGGRYEGGGNRGGDRFGDRGGDRGGDRFGGGSDRFGDRGGDRGGDRFGGGDRGGDGGDKWRPSRGRGGDRDRGPPEPRNTRWGPGS